MNPIRSIEDIEAGLAALFHIDPRLVTIAERAGPLPLRLAEPGFAGLAHIVVSQMVSRASAEAIWGRILLAAGEGLSAERYLMLTEEPIAGFGLSGAKARTLKGLAEAVVSGAIDLDAVTLAPLDEAMAELTRLPGIGPWTAEVYLMFSGGHPDVFPAGDVALRAAVGWAFELPERPDITRVRQISAPWSPWRSVAARLFWAFYATRLGREAAPAA
ncbi:DNA-3-methyladenine glycosylase 2 family protein [Ciceribacter sp. L1K23]|uniref:DNA-3-methyladenine glycosylase family protein n=1 Tax=Ciceribacter sp. L1K23 TaxID=2820276 RepID=UPI001B824A32|nr:DNA-3-methyladenine glycosylase [Ciceribacter sp. L1K23]MBR0554269.1 DNA-3-methyladenine glycosylase 2 family protein [Ciceribacter sp. L1K23]